MNIFLLAFPCGISVGTNVAKTALATVKQPVY